MKGKTNMNFNQVTLMGRLTRDPELRTTKNGTPVCDIGMAVNRFYTDSDGNKKEETTFVDVTLWDKQATLVSEMTKGEPIFIDGRLELDEWTTSEGQKRSKLRVVANTFQFLAPRPDRSTSSASDETSAATAGEAITTA